VSRRFTACDSRCDVALPGSSAGRWKSDFHGTPEAFELLDGVVDVYIADFKFGNDACAKRLSGVDRYTRSSSETWGSPHDQGRLIVRQPASAGTFSLLLSADRRVAAGESS